MAQNSLRFHIEQAIAAVQSDILARAGCPIPTSPHQWEWLCRRAFYIACRPLRTAPSAWDLGLHGRFQGWLRGDPHNPEGDCCIEYLALGTAEQQMRRIVHELAEYLLLLQLSSVFDNRDESLLQYPRDESPAGIRHRAAAQIEHSIAQMAFPTPKPEIANSFWWAKESREWHQNHAPLPEGHYVRIEGVDYAGMDG